MPAQRIEFLGLPLDLGLTIPDICAQLSQKGQLRLNGYISPSSWAVAKKYPEYLPSMQTMTTIRAGGEGVARVCRWLNGDFCPRISFDMTSLADPFFKTVVAQNASVVLIGGKLAIDEAMHEKLRHQYPQIRILATTHGFGDLEPKIALVMKYNPDVVLIGMGSPRQEIFMQVLGVAGYTGMAISCGGFFDQYLEASDYYPDWVDRYNLRFAWRFYKEPRRLWRRYLIDYQLFVWQAVKALLGKYTPPQIRQLFFKIRNKVLPR